MSRVPLERIRYQRYGRIGYTVVRDDGSAIGRVFKNASTAATTWAHSLRPHATHPSRAAAANDLAYLTPPPSDFVVVQAGVYCDGCGADVDRPGQLCPPCRQREG